MDYLDLNTGARMPLIGLGTWKSETDKVGAAVACALTDCGYRQIDCAYIYHNEAEIGRAFDQVFSAGLKRQDVFVTSKLWLNSFTAEDVLPACQKTLSDLRLDYLDLYLMHWGVAIAKGQGDEPLYENGRLVTAKIPLRETWTAMEALVKQGFVKAIGVANFTGPMLVDLLTYARLVPAMNQIELHPYNQQQKLVEFCQSENIAVTAYSPLGSPGNTSRHQDNLNLFNDPVINQLAQKYGKDPAQILLRWGIQRRTVVIPKSVHPDRIKSNIQVFDFSLNQEDMDLIAALDKRHRFVDPDEWWHIPYFD